MLNAKEVKAMLLVHQRSESPKLLSQAMNAQNREKSAELEKVQ